MEEQASVGSIDAKVIQGNLEWLPTKHLVFQDGEEKRVGRTTQSDLSLPSDSVSSNHGYLGMRGNKFYYTDNESTNGTSLLIKNFR